MYQQEALLVSAPTGIGKTMAVLYPAVKQSLKLGKKLFFLTSKTMQQDAAVEALKLLNDGSFRVLRIRAKQKMCAHTEMICHEDFCPYAARYSEKMQRTDLLDHWSRRSATSIRRSRSRWRKSNEVCPFEVSLELIEQADVIVCDYNYIFDPYVGLKAYQQENDYGDCVLVVDEAHNLVDRGRGYYSPELHRGAVRPHPATSGRPQLLARRRRRSCWKSCAEHFHELAESLGEDPDVKQSLCEPDRELFLEQRTEWERLVMYYIGWKIENRIVETDDPLIDFYFKLVKVANLMTEKGDEFAHLDRAHPEGPEVQNLLQGSLALPRPHLRIGARHDRALRHARAVRFLPQAPRLSRRSHDARSRCRRPFRAAIARSW